MDAFTPAELNALAALALREGDRRWALFLNGHAREGERCASYYEMAAKAYGACGDTRAKLRCLELIAEMTLEEMHG
jgi:hypothetical protein